ncbi:MAG: bifunctional metallophosphatase/5'-nucleotidase [Bacillota bacterium]
MKKMLLALALVFTFTLAACSESSPETPDNTSGDTEDYLDIYHTNDVHGAIEGDDDSLGLGRMGNLMLTRKEEAPENTLILDGGDALQGSALSNYYEGESMIEIMNVIGYDAMVVGNHEFDWGLETATEYFKEDGVADFPLLGANIIEDETGEIPDNIDPYTVVEKGGRTIGIIGTIGYGLESSIAPSVVEGYTFTDPEPIIKDHAETLRQEEGADLVFVLSHDPDGINSYALSLEGDAKIDAVFNAHSHQNYAYTEDTTAVMQSGGYGSHVGQVTFTWDQYGLSGVSAQTLDDKDSDLLTETHPDVMTLINAYKEETDSIFNEPIISTPNELSRDDLSIWIAGLMAHATGADIGYQNGGGTRNSIPEGEITLGNLYDVWPFENQIKTASITGSEVKAQMEYNVYQSDVNSFENNELYKIATNDFVFDQDRAPFMDGENIVETDYYIRDLALEELELQSEVFDEFSVDNPYQVPAS